MVPLLTELRVYDFPKLVPQRRSAETFQVASECQPSAITGHRPQGREIMM